MNALTKWIDQRTGLWTAWQDCRKTPTTVRPFWQSIWPSTILFTFFVEAVSGFFLWCYYSPSAQTAWESIYYIQYEVAGGWLLRGIHYYAGQMLLVLLGLYILSMIVSGAYRAPRELLFWLAVGMAVVTIALLLTADLLTWSQRGYWSTDVRTKFLFLLPGVGSSLYKIAVGGPTMGHLTLTRFVALHAGVLTVVLGGLLALHVLCARRADAQESAAAARPRLDPMLANAIACLVVLGIVLVASVWGGLAQADANLAPADYLGAELGSPRDPGDAYAAARPDWYFVGLYEFAHHFSGALKIVPIFVVPGLLVALFLVMPFLARYRAGHVLNIVVTVALLGAAVGLTWVSKNKDATDPAFQVSLVGAEHDATRVKQLIQGKGIPGTGALTLLWSDAKTQGPKLFRQQCASCHDYDTGEEATRILAQDPTAPNLHRFAGDAWISGMLDPKQIGYAPPVDPKTGKIQATPTDRPKYFGNTKFKSGEMVEFVKGNLRELRKDIGDKEYRAMIAALVTESTRKPGAKPSDQTKQLVGDFTCTDCHQFHGLAKEPTAPDLTGYGSREWLIGIISNPSHGRFYGKDNDRMPAYAEFEAVEKNILSAAQVALLADWLRETWYEPAEVAQATEP